MFWLSSINLKEDFFNTFTCLSFCSVLSDWLKTPPKKMDLLPMLQRYTKSSRKNVRSKYQPWAHCTHRPAKECKQSVFKFTLLVGETLQWIWWQRTNKQAGGPKHPASFFSVYLPDVLAIRYESLLKDVQKRHVNTSPQMHTYAHTRTVENSVTKEWERESDRWMRSDWSGGGKKQKGIRRVFICLSVARCSAVPPAVIPWKLLSTWTCVRSTCPRNPQPPPPPAPFYHVQQASGRLFQEDQRTALIFRG